MVLASYCFITIGYSRHIISIWGVYLAHFLSFSCIITVSSHDHRVWRIKPFRYYHGVFFFGPRRIGAVTDSHGAYSSLDRLAR